MRFELAEGRGVPRGLRGVVGRHRVEVPWRREPHELADAHALADGPAALGRARPRPVAREAAQIGLDLWAGACTGAACPRACTHMWPWAWEGAHVACACTGWRARGPIFSCGGGAIRFIRNAMRACTHLARAAHLAVAVPLGVQLEQLERQSEHLERQLEQ